MRLREYRLLSAVKAYGLPLVVLFIILSAYFAYAYAQTPAVARSSRTVSEPFYSWSGGLSGGGIITAENPLWPVGSEVSLPLYPTDVSELAELNFHFEVSGKDVNLEFNRELKVVYYIAYDNHRVIEETYASVSNVSNGQGFADELRLNITDIAKRIAETRSVLRLPRETAGVEIVGTVHYSGTVGGRGIRGNQTFRGEIKFPYEGFYSISGDAKNGTITRSRTVTESYPVNGRKRAILLTLSGVFGILALTSLIVWRRFDPETYSVRELELLEQEAKLAKWVSRGRLENFESTTRIKFESLRDLVDAAIDMNARVLYDRKNGTYFFLHEGILYYYSRPSFRQLKNRPKH
ncbi:DUF5305 family protein [Palaeococcus ferrophilus]|uniref:DUF5305 family protein n=1 Tax=Palaeococcus ferrophilus TaxID=83868 RepID=UPI00064F1E7C|nr:DUF5305 family protein [Palaeococcus ferrophilus]